jgi:RNA polymerase sigma-70 factor (ECF subfamily)
MSSLAGEIPMPQDAALRERFARLLEQQGPGLRRVARAYAARTSETEDLLQEIAVGIWRALPSFRGECSERTFAFRVAHNRGLTFAERARPPHPDPEKEEASDAPGPEERLGDARRREALWRGIHQLAPGARAVVTLALEGLSHEEIGEVLGIKVNAVAVRLTRARDELKRILGGTHEAR